MALQTFKHFAHDRGIAEQTISTWFNREVAELGGKKKYMEFDFKHKYFVIRFHVIDGRLFIDPEKSLGYATIEELKAKQ